jgi:hypothetical protein
LQNGGNSLQKKYLVTSLMFILNFQNKDKVYNDFKD